MGLRDRARSAEALAKPGNTETPGKQEGRAAEPIYAIEVPSLVIEKQTGARSEGIGLSALLGGQGQL